MEFLIHHWYTIVLALLLAISVYLHIRKFALMSPKQRYEQIRGWLLQAVLFAEQMYGPGTGKLKLSEVYARFCEELPWLAKVLPFDTFSKYVDDALEEMRKILENNAAIAEIVGVAPAKEAVQDERNG